ncbi:uncharacterized protein LOC142652397 isoform X2 [Rhinoderma darwinii]|uniref:uncharacterized protein LOC142652397 isoform X2 n=1 Tax=Rhinoderma darwinii TaxID=43563 RepID=UPI003F669277
MSSKHPVKPRCKYMFQRRELGQPVKCSLQQYNQYNDYIDRKMAQLERQTMDEQNVKKRIEVINRNNAQTMKKIREREQYKQHLLERMEMNWQENNLQMLSHMNEMTQQDTKKPKPKKKKGSSKQ